MCDYTCLIVYFSIYWLAVYCNQFGQTLQTIIIAKLAGININIDVYLYPDFIIYNAQILLPILIYYNCHETDIRNVKLFDIHNKVVFILI